MKSVLPATTNPNKKKGCCGDGKKSVKQIPAASNREPIPTASIVEDFVCGICGDVKRKRRRGYDHFCKGPLPVVWRDEHESTCMDCPSGKNWFDPELCEWVCLDQRSRKPDCGNVISDGCAMSHARCNLGHFDRVGFYCPECGARNHHGEWCPVHCEYCGYSLFDPASGNIGFIGLSYLAIGGTEIWHRTLLPSLDDVTGYVAMTKKYATGNPSSLKVPFGIGMDDAKRLALASDTLVVWGLLGDQMEAILQGKKKRVIAVAHCDNKSAMTVQSMDTLSPFADRYVYLEPRGIKAIPESRRSDAVMIRNGVSIDRISSTLTRYQAREKLGVSSSQKLIAMVTRLSPEKNIHLAIQAMESLPSDYVLVIVGRTKATNDAYRSSESDRVRIFDAVDLPGDIFRAADAHLCTSDFEGACLSMIEAAMAGVPLISTRTGIVGSNPQMAKIITGRKTADNIALAIGDDFVHPDRQRTRAQQAETWAKASYSGDRFVREWAELLNGHRASSAREVTD